MFLARMIALLVVSFIRCLITPIKPGPAAIAAVIPGQQGAMADYAAMTVILQALATNGSPAHANWSTTLIPNSITARTYSAQEILSGIIRRFAPSGATVDCTDTATNIVNAIPGAVVNQTFLSIIAAMGSTPLTVAAGTGVTMAGTNVIGGFSARIFMGQVLGSSAVTLTPLFSLPLQSGL